MLRPNLLARGLVRRLPMVRDPRSPVGQDCSMDRSPAVCGGRDGLKRDPMVRTLDADELRAIAGAVE